MAYLPGPGQSTKFDDDETPSSNLTGTEEHEMR